MDKELDIDENHKFHDSIIYEIKKTDNELEIVIHIDTYWFQGKKNGKLTLKNAKFDESIIKYVDDKYPFDNLDRLTHIKVHNEHIFEIVFQSNQEKIWKITADSFTFERYD